MPIHLSQEEFSELVERAIESIPPQFAQYMENLSVEVHPRPTRQLIGDLDIEDWENLLGLYHGLPLTAKSVEIPIDWPERIFIFQRNIESMCRTPEEVVEEVRTTILHEIGHHFGMDEDDLGELGYD
jgi:predicted Zn-dependent protease with MMP-like domain